MTTTELVTDTRFLALVEGLGDPETWAIKVQRGNALQTEELQRAGALPEGAEGWLEAFNGSFLPWLANEPKIVPAETPGIPAPRPLLRRTLRRPSGPELVGTLARGLHSWLALRGELGPIRLAIGYLSAFCGLPVLELGPEDCDRSQSLPDLEARLARRLTEAVYSPAGEVLSPVPDPIGLTWRYRGTSGTELLVEWHELSDYLSAAPSDEPSSPPQAPPMPPI